MTNIINSQICFCKGNWNQISNRWSTMAHLLGFVLFDNTFWAYFCHSPWMVRSIVFLLFSCILYLLDLFQDFKTDDAWFVDHLSIGGGALGTKHRRAGYGLNLSRIWSEFWILPELSLLRFYIFTIKNSEGRRILVSHQGYLEKVGATRVGSHYRRACQRRWALPEKVNVSGITRVSLLCNGRDINLIFF